MLLALVVGCGGEPNYERSTEPAPDAADRIAKMVAKISTDAASTTTIERRATCGMLGGYGKVAESALPALEQAASQDADESVRKAAAEAVEKIKAAMAAPAQ